MASPPDEARAPWPGSATESEQSGQLWDAPIEILRGADSVNRRVARVFGEARRELLLFIGQPMLADAEVQAAFGGLQRRGVVVRQLLTREFLEAADVGSRRYLALVGRLLVSSGRLAEELPGKLIVVDRRIGLVALNQETGARHQAVLLQHRELVVHLLASFEHHWEQAEPLPA